MLYHEYKVMKWKPPPPNPLAHKSIRTTLERYAKQGADSMEEARLRCLKKYKGHPEFHQDWMD